MILPIEERAVRIAQRDTDGNDIAAKSAAIEGAVEALQEAIEGKVGFDGEYAGTTLKDVSYDSKSFDKDFAAYVFSSASEGLYKAGKDIFNVHRFGPENAFCSLTYYRMDNKMLIYVATITTAPTEDITANYRSPIYPRSPGVSDENNLLWDTTPTEDSNKPVTSGGVYAALAGIQTGTKLYKHDISVTFAYTYDAIDKNVTLTLTYISNKSTALTETTFKQLMYYNRLNKFTTSIVEPGDIWLFLDNGQRIDPVAPASGLLDNCSTRFFNTGEFNRVGGLSLYSSYPGGSLTLVAYGPDKIDLTTGEMVARTNLASNGIVTFNSDTVTAL